MVFFIGILVLEIGNVCKWLVKISIKYLFREE